MKVGDIKTFQVVGIDVDFKVIEVHNGHLICRSVCGKWGVGMTPQEWKNPIGNVIG